MKTCTIAAALLMMSGCGDIDGQRDRWDLSESPAPEAGRAPEAGAEGEAIEVAGPDRATEIATTIGQSRWTEQMVGCIPETERLEFRDDGMFVFSRESWGSVSPDQDEVVETYGSWAVDDDGVVEWTYTDSYGTFRQERRTWAVLDGPLAATVHWTDGLLWPTTGFVSADDSGRRFRGEWARVVKNESTDYEHRRGGVITEVVLSAPLEELRSGTNCEVTIQARHPESGAVAQHLLGCEVSASDVATVFTLRAEGLPDDAYDAVSAWRLAQGSDDSNAEVVAATVPFWTFSSEDPLVLVGPNADSILGPNPP